MENRELSYIEIEELHRQESHPINQQQFTLELEQEEQMAIVSEHSTLFYANNDHAVKVTLLCTVLTMLFYSIARIQGRIRTKVHGGLHLFWNCLLFGDVAVCLTTLAVASRTYFGEEGYPGSLTCISASPINKYFAYGWLLIWVIFVVAVLRGTVAITWLNRIRDVERLADMGRGVGILCLSLIYLFPLALISRSNADSILGGFAPVTVCVPTFRYGVAVDTLYVYVFASWMLAIIAAMLSSGRVNQANRSSRMAVPIAVATHFVPTMMLFIWLTNILDVEEFRDTVPAIYASIAALNALCNFFTYKLFPLAAEDAELKTDFCHKCNDENTTELFENTKSKLQINEPPPIYTEKFEVV